MRVYIPTYLGDVRLERDGLETTKLVCGDLTEFERRKIGEFLKKVKVPEPDELERSTVTIPGSFDKIHKTFLAIFKAGKPVINAVKLHDGQLKLVQEFSNKDFAAGVTVEKPGRGCPLPIWERKEIVAQEVLREFLTPAQWGDFEARRMFISRGDYSHEPYLLVSRWSPSCETFGVLYSLTHQRSICASMPELPPAEELLAMKLCVELDEFNFVQGVGGVNL